MKQRLKLCRQGRGGMGKILILNKLKLIVLLNESYIKTLEVVNI